MTQDQIQIIAVKDTADLQTSRSGRRLARMTYLVVAFSSLVVAAGCASYRTPSGGADMAIFSDADIKTVLDRKPAAVFPAQIATVRVQEPNYRSYSARGYGYGRFSVVSVRDVEKQEDFDRIADFPMVGEVVALNRLLLSGPLDSDQALRRAAASLHTDVLLLYTFDTSFFVDDAARPLTVVTLGLSPHKQVRVTTTASAVLIDVRTGFVYGACENTVREDHFASAWTDSQTVDRSRLETERAAFESLLDELEALWRDIAADRSSLVSQKDGPG